MEEKENKWSNHEKWTFIIAVFVLIAIIIFSILQFNLSKRQDNLNSIIEQRQFQKGEVQLVVIMTRYFMSFINAWDSTNQKKSFLKKDEISIKQYLKECKSISTDLNQLINNPFYIDLLEKYPEIIRTSVQLNYNIVEQEIKSQNNLEEFKLSNHTFTYFYSLFKILKKENSKSKILNSKMLKDLEKLIEEFIKVNPQLIIEN